MAEQEDFDPEAPSEEDLARFGGDHAECSGCGAEIYDDAPQCPACGKWLSGLDHMGSGRMPSWLMGLVVVLIVISFVMYYVI